MQSFTVNNFFNTITNYLLHVRSQEVAQRGGSSQRGGSYAFYDGVWALVSEMHHGLLSVSWNEPIIETEHF